MLSAECCSETALCRVTNLTLLCLLVTDTHQLEWLLDLDMGSSLGHAGNINICGIATRTPAAKVRGAVPADQTLSPAAAKPQL